MVRTGKRIGCVAVMALVFAIHWGSGTNALSQTSDGVGNVVIELFMREDSEQCRRIAAYLKVLQASRTGVDVKSYDVIADRSALARLWQLSRDYHYEKAGVPAVYLADNLLMGFHRETPERIESLLRIRAYVRPGCRHCADAKRFLDQCFETHCAYNVGELGLGTNTMVKSPIFLNSHINERRPGVHLGFGQHNQDPGVVGYQCAIHLDLVADGGIIRFKDGSPEIDLEDVAPSMSAHPLSTRDEDVFSPESYDLEIDDCCGILTKDGLSLVDFKDCS